MEILKIRLSLCRPQYMYWTMYSSIYLSKKRTVLPAKSDSDVMFCLQSYQDLESIDHVCISPIRRIGLIHE